MPRLLSIAGDLRGLGVVFCSLTGHTDTTSPLGELLFGIFGALAQHERALIRERVVAGLGRPRSAGRASPGELRRGARRDPRGA